MNYKNKALISIVFIIALAVITCFTPINSMWWQRFTSRFPKFSKVNIPNTKKNPHPTPKLPKTNLPKAETASSEKSPLTNIPKVEKASSPQQPSLAKDTLKKIGLATLGLSTAAYLLGPNEALCDYACQTDAYLSLEGAKEGIEKAYGKSIKELNLQPILDAAVEKEREMAKKGYYAFYHGEAKEVFLYQKIVTEYMEQAKKKRVKDFYFLRYPELSFNEEMSPSSISKILGWNGDENPYVASKLLSVNLSIYGNTETRLPCSSLNLALTNNNISDAGINALLTFSSQHNLNPIALNELRDLTKKVYATGILLQIFLLPHEIEKIGYSSAIRGFPGLEYGKIMISPGSSFESIEPNYSLNLPLQKLVEEYKNNPSLIASHSEYQTEFDWMRPLCSLRLARAIAEGKRNSKEQLKALDATQARLMFNNKILLNPDSGIKMFSYTKRDAALEKILDAKIKDIVANALKNHR